MDKKMEYNHLKEFMERVENTMQKGFEQIHEDMKTFTKTQNDHEIRLNLLEQEKEIKKNSFEKIVTIISLIVGIFGLVAMFISLK